MEVSGSMHDFWYTNDAGQRRNDMIPFSENVALPGAASVLAGLEEP